MTPPNQCPKCGAGSIVVFDGPRFHYACHSIVQDGVWHHTDKCRIHKLEKQLAAERERNAYAQFIERAIRLQAEYDGHDYFWHINDNGKLIPSINCNDLFAWACGDGEDVTPENITILEQAYADLKATDPEDCTATMYAGELFACRVRKMRPQGCCYPKNRKLWPLFDACGPERPVGIGNPYTPESYYEKHKDEGRYVSRAQHQLQLDLDAERAKVAKLRERINYIHDIVWCIPDDCKRTAREALEKTK